MQAEASAAAGNSASAAAAAAASGGGGGEGKGEQPAAALPSTPTRSGGACSRGNGREVRKTRLFAPFYTKIDYFTKTCSGQTQGKLKKQTRFLSGHLGPCSF
eukprot:COSAG06_NODE_2368_length_6998_cov_3.945934_9_plen_102_part_00